jgi:carboxymethylenebutenolidase
MMRKTLLAVASLLLAAAPVMAQHDHPHATVAPSKAHPGKSITFPGTAGTASGYFAAAKTKSKAKHPALVVIQEWWGVTDWVKDQADRFAAQGYDALAVDLYRGKATDDPAVAHELMRGMPEDRALADLRAGFNYLAAQKDVDATRIGAIGWCMGGGYSLALAVAEPRLAACVMNYGRLVTDPKSIAALHAPLLGDFGADDRGIPPADVQAFDAALKKAGKSSDIKIYPGSGHGFMNPNNKEGYNAAATADAWKRIDTFFTKRLMGK